MRYPNLTTASLALALLAGTGLVACGGSAPRDGDAGQPGADEPFATVIIDNDATRIVTVFAIRSGTRMRLGTVAGVSRKEFPLRRSMVDASGEVQLMVDPLGSPERYYSDSIVVDPGDVIQLRVSALIR
jgi:hypothetical protein